MPDLQRTLHARPVASPSAGVCAVLGHEIDNRLAVRGASPRCRRCGERFLFEDGRVTHTRHVLGCFLRHHTYVRTDRRAGHHEYTCVRCGHPLLLAVDADPYQPSGEFPKRVRYLCGVFGHTVHEITVRGGYIEYGCDCGHSFLLTAKGLTRVTHPFICRMSGHRVAFVERRGQYHEHRCLDCGHTFGWMATGTVRAAG